MSQTPRSDTDGERPESKSESTPGYTARPVQPLQFYSHVPLGEDDEDEAKAYYHGKEPPSPTSTGSAIAVGLPGDTTLMASLENGDYANAESDSDDTRSLTDSVRQHIIDGGLRYHAYHAGQYAFPNDETEQYRDDLKHALSIHLAEGRYFCSPVHNVLQDGAEVLDLGRSAPHRVKENPPY